MPGTFLSFKDDPPLRKRREAAGGLDLYHCTGTKEAGLHSLLIQEAGRLTWNGGCDCWLDGVGLLHKGLDAGEKMVDMSKLQMQWWLLPRLGLGLQ